MTLQEREVARALSPLSLCFFLSLSKYNIEWSQVLSIHDVRRKNEKKWKKKTEEEACAWRLFNCRPFHSRRLLSPTSQGVCVWMCLCVMCHVCVCVCVCVCMLNPKLGFGMYGLGLLRVSHIYTFCRPYPRPRTRKSSVRLRGTARRLRWSSCWERALTPIHPTSVMRCACVCVWERDAGADEKSHEQNAKP